MDDTAGTNARNGRRPPRAAPRSPARCPLRSDSGAERDDGSDGGDRGAGVAGSGRAEFRWRAANACSRRTAACRPTSSGSARITFPSAEPTTPSSSAVELLSRTAITSTSASVSVKTTGGSLVPRPSRYPPYGPLADSTGMPASRRMPMYRRAARSVTPNRSPSSPAVAPGRDCRNSSARNARAVGLGSVGTSAP